MKKQVQFLDKNISYQISGNGPALVLLHGFLESEAIWADFTSSLQNNFNVIAIDLPGHGDSDSLAETHSMQLMAAAIKEVLLHENIEQAVIAGHSMGGYVALQFGNDNPELLKGLVLFHSHANADSNEAKENRNRTIKVIKQNRGGFIRQFIPGLFDQKHLPEYSDPIRNLQETASLMSPEAIVAAVSGMRDRPSLLKFLSSTSIPVLFIIGKQDSRMPYDQVVAQAVLPAHSEILLLENVGHMGFIEAPGKTLSMLGHFAKRCYEE